MPTTKGKVYLGEQLICHTLTDIETETLAFEQMNASDLPYCSSKAPTSLRPVQPGYCLTFNGTTHRIDAAHLAGTETVVSSQGTSTPSVSAGQIDFTAGTSNNIILSDGTQYNLNESTGTVAIDSSGNNNDGTLVNGPTWTTDNSLPYSWLNQVGYGGSSRVVWSGGAGWDDGCYSEESAAGDFVVRMPITEAAVNQFLGVNSDPTTTGGFTTLDNALLMTSSFTLAAYESGVSKTSTTFIIGDVVEIVRVGTTITYLKNSVVFYTSLVSSTANLYVDTAFNGNGSNVSNVTLDGVYVTWVDVPNCTVSNIYIPRDEATPANDAFGNALQWSGSAFPRRPEYRGSYGVSFDGTDDYIDSGVATASDTYIEATIKKSAVVNTRYAFGCNNSSGTERIYVDDRTGLFRAIIGTSSDTLDFAATTGMIYTLRLYTNGDFYVDGVLVGNTGGTMDVAEDVYFGARNNGGSPATYWGGEMYGASVYSSGALTTYTLSEGVGATAHDISGNGNDGTITNASTATEGAGFWAGRIDGEANAHNINNGFSRRMLFDGVNDAVLFDGTAYAAKTKGKISGSFMIDGASALNTIVAFTDETDTNSDFRITIQASGKIEVVIRQAGVSSLFLATTGVFDDGLIHSYSFTVTDSGNELLVDGVAVGVIYSSGSAATKKWVSDVSDVDVFSVGVRQESTPDNFFNGVVYDVTLYDEDGATAIGQWNGNGNTNADWLDTVGSNNGTVNGSPALLRVPADSAAPTLDVYGDTLTNPAVANSHNDAETTWDVYNIGTGDVPCPESNSNSGLSAIAFDADLTADDSAYMHLATSVLNDRLIAFSADLTGGDKTLAEKYTE